MNKKNRVMLLIIALVLGGFVLTLAVSGTSTRAPTQENPMVAQFEMDPSVPPLSEVICSTKEEQKGSDYGTVTTAATLDYCGESESARSFQGGFQKGDPVVVLRGKDKNDYVLPANGTIEAIEKMGLVDKLH